MKILAITHDFPTRSQAYRGAPIWHTLRALQRHAELSVICPVPRMPAPFRGVQKGIWGCFPAPPGNCEFPVIAAPYSAAPRLTHAWNGHTLRRRLEPLVRSQSPDVLLCYWIYPDAWAGWQVGRALGVPVIAGSRGSDLKVPETVASVRSKIASTVRGVDALLCVSEDLGVAARGLGAPPNRVFAVPNGIDARTFHFQEQAAARRSLDLAAGKRIVVFIGRLVNMKGVLQLSDAVARLNEGGAGTWTAVFIGEGPLRSQLTGPHVLATGPRKPDEIAAWLAAADVFCLPSESEGCPNVVQEALSCGCPVVATSVGGIPDMVGSDCGILVPDHDPERLAKALAQVVALDWDRKKMARTHTRSWEQVAEATFQVCEFAVGSREAYAVGR